MLYTGITYLDHAAATLYSSKQLEAHYKDLTSHLYSNPHSGSPSSKLTSALVDSARELVLQHFNTDSEHYDVIFTAGCTAALDLLCHAFPWAEGRSLFCYLDDNHTSVVGMREVARSGGAKTFCMSPTEVRISHCNGLSEPHPPSACNSEPHPQRKHTFLSRTLIFLTVNPVRGSSLIRSTVYSPNTIT